MRWMVLMLVAVTACGSSPPTKGRRKPRPRSPGTVLWQALPALPATGGATAATDQGPMGTAQPFLPMGGSKRWKWLIACQPPAKYAGRTFEVKFGMHGDLWGAPLEPHLFTGPGPGRLIESYLGRDPSGRFIGVVEGGEARVIDMETGAHRDLRRLGRWSHVRFDPEAQRLALLRRTAAQYEVVLLDLPTGAVHVAYRTPAEIKWLYFEEGALKLGEVFRDTDRNGRLDAGRLRTSLAAGACMGPIASFSTSGYDGDEPVERKVKVPPGPTVGREHIRGHRDECLPDGRPIIASQDGAYLVGTPPREAASQAPDGPVEWIATDVAPVACPER